jgi:hypothetical protein
MKKMEVRISVFIGGLAVILIMTTSVWAVSPPVTVATFADPSDGSIALFEVNLETKIINGFWLSVYENLDLAIPIAGAGTTYEDVRFVMPDVTITDETSPMFGIKTEEGVISFYENDSAVDALVEITFDSAWITYTGFSASDFYADDNVTISGSQISGTLNGGSFSFAFANHKPIEGDWDKGFTATAAFTSSVPEPVTMLLLGLGGLLAINKKKRHTL